MTRDGDACLVEGSLAPGLVPGANDRARKNQKGQLKVPGRHGTGPVAVWSSPKTSPQSVIARPLDRSPPGCVRRSIPSRPNSPAVEEDVSVEDCFEPREHGVARFDFGLVPVQGLPKALPPKTRSAKGRRQFDRANANSPASRNRLLSGLRSIARGNSRSPDVTDDEGHPPNRCSSPKIAPWPLPDVPQNLESL